MQALEVMQRQVVTVTAEASIDETPPVGSYQPQHE